MKKSKKELVYELVKKIPQGKVVTYSHLAKLLKWSSPRQIGQILHQNPDPKNIPCHRVVFADGRLSPSYAFGGAKKQKEKLENEGIEFVNNKVNLEKHQIYSVII